MRAGGKWQVWHSGVIAGLIGALILILLLSTDRALISIWLGGVGILVIFLFVTGHGITGRWIGVLVDNRNRVSLSRLQMALWSLLILPAIYSVVLGNADAGSATPLSVTIPADLWILMGISTASLVGSPLLTSAKTAKTPDKIQDALQLNELARQGVDVQRVSSDGLIIKKRSISDASWGDLVRGEETGNAAQLDLARIQMLFITLVLILGYGGALVALLQQGAEISSFPPVDAGMIALLSLSHAGYLTNKVVPHSKEAGSE